MTTKLLTFVLFLSFYAMISQEKKHEIKLILPEHSSSTQIIDEENKQVSLFTIAEQYIDIQKFDSDFKRIDSLLVDKPTEEFNFISGHSVDKNSLKLFWSTKDEKKVLSKTINYQTKEVTENEFDLVFEKEFTIQKFTTNKNFYILRLVKNTSLLKFYIFSDNGKHEVKEVDLSSLTFYGKKGEEKNLYKILTGSAFEAFLDLSIITNDTPTSLILAKRKLYINDKSITFSFDINTTMTQLFTIDLVDYSFKEEKIKQTYFEENESYTPKSNSFFIKDKLFQIKLTPERFVLNVTDSDRTKSNQFEATTYKNISFNNSDMIQEHAGTQKTKIIENKNQFLLRMNDYNPLVSCNISGDGYIVTIGSNVLVDTGASSVAPMFGIIGALASAALTQRNNMNPYKNHRVVYTHCLFDKHLNHIEDKVQNTAFDRARIYIDNLKKQTNTTFFKFNNMVYVGSFDKNLKKYTFSEFVD